MAASHAPVTEPPPARAGPAGNRTVELPARARIGGAHWALADQTVVSAGSFVAVYLLARFMGIAEFGTYMAAWIALHFLTSLQGALLSEPHNVLGAQRDAEAYRRLTTVLAAALLTGALALGMLLVAAGGVACALEAGTLGRLLMMLGLVVIPFLAQEFVRRTLYTRSETRAACVNDAVSQGLQVLGIATLIVSVRSPSALLALVVIGASSLAAALVGAWQLRKHVVVAALARSTRGAIWHETWFFGKWLLARNLVSWLGQYGHNWLLLALLGPAALGTYRAADHLLNLVNPLRLAAYSYLPARASRRCAEGGPDALRHWIGHVYRTVGVAFGALILLLILFSKPLLQLAYGEKFNELPLEWIIVFGGLAAVVNFARIPLEMAILAMQQSRRLFWVHVWSVPMLLTLGTGLIVRLGVFGVPISSLAIGCILLALTRRAVRAGAAGVDTGAVASTARPGARPGSANEAGVNRPPWQQPIEPEAVT